MTTNCALMPDGVGSTGLGSTGLGSNGPGSNGPVSAGAGSGNVGSGGGAGGTKVVAEGNGDQERLARVGLSRVVEPGDVAALKAFDGLPPVEIWDRLQRNAPGLERWSTRLAEAEPRRDLERAAAAGARFVIPGDDEWPDQVEVLFLSPLR